MVSILVPTGVLLAVYWGWYFGWQRKRGVPLTVPLAFTCLFIPKVNLFNVNPMYSTAGIRTDDFLALILLIVAIRDVQTWKDKRIQWGIGILCALTVASIIGLITGRANGYDNEILYAIMSIIREYEYFAFALIGMYIARKTPQAEKIAMKEVIWASGFHAAIALMQVFRICGYAVAGLVSDQPANWPSGIAVSTFNGHYEYGQFLCFAIVIYLCTFLRTRKIRYLFSTVGSCVMIWLTDSRSSLMVGLLMIVLILLLSIRKETKPGLKVATGGIILLAVGAVVLFLTGTLKIGRFNVVNLNEYAEALRMYIEKGDLHRYVTIFRDNAEFSGITEWISDRSASGRFYLWGSVLDGFRQFPIFGYGPGVTHVTDGNYIRLLGEGGIVGTLLYLSLLGYYMHIMRKERERIPAAKSVFYMFVSVLFASAFIDMFRASKPMEMLWLAVGLVIGVSSLKSEENNHLSGERV